MVQRVRTAAAGGRATTTMADFSYLGGPGPLRLEDHRRWPGARLVIHCAACSWARGYDPDAIVRRLQALRAGGYRTEIADVAKRIAWPCPACGRMRWCAALGYPKSVDPRDVTRAMRATRC